jgi:polyhydroxyalkanoate synthesis regulator phasin
MATESTAAKPKAKKAPARKAAAKKSTAKKTTAKKSTAKKSTTRKATPKQAAQPNFAVKAQENARNVFLAGLGFYGKAFEEAQNQIEDAQARMKQRREKAEDLFNELVKRGEKVESEAKKRIKDIELPELKLADRDEVRMEIRARLDKARESFDALRESITVKAA